jgi:hypothetical protein
VVVDGAEDTSRLDGHHAHSQLVARHTWDLGAQINGGQEVHRDTLRLRRHLFVAHRGVLSVTRGPNRNDPTTASSVARATGAE